MARENEASKTELLEKAIIKAAPKIAKTISDYESRIGKQIENYSKTMTLRAYAYEHIIYDVITSAGKDGKQ